MVVLPQLWNWCPTQWNIGGELCSGLAIDLNIDINIMNPGIKCDCTYNSRSTCRITGLRNYPTNVVGPILDELWNLTYLTNIDLGLNYLTGPLPPSIGRLTRMQYLNFGINALSGELPKELGMLTDLRVLRFQGNSFEGTIPTSFSNSTSLTDLRISDLSNGSSSLDFPRDMKSLSTLF